MSSIYLGNINPGVVNAKMASAVLHAATAGVISRVWLKPSPPYLDIHRNIIVMDFLNESDCDKLLFVDSDVVFTADDVKTLDEANLPVISGWYNNPNENGEVHPVVYYWGPREESNGEHTSTVQFKTFDEIEALPEVAPRICQVTAAGTGFVMLQRDLLADMSATFSLPTPWFVEQGVVGAPGEDPVWHGEDLMFGLRAAQMGCPWHVHKDIHLAHYKTAMI